MSRFCVLALVALLAGCASDFSAVVAGSADRCRLMGFSEEGSEAERLAFRGCVADEARFARAASGALPAALMNGGVSLATGGALRAIPQEVTHIHKWN